MSFQKRAFSGNRFYFSNRKQFFFFSRRRHWDNFIQFLKLSSEVRVVFATANFFARRFRQFVCANGGFRIVAAAASALRRAPILLNLLNFQFWQKIGYFEEVPFRAFLWIPKIGSGGSSAQSRSQVVLRRAVRGGGRGAFGVRADDRRGPP